MLTVYLFVFSESFKLPESVKWLKLNYRNTGFYIVHYGDEGWAALIDALSKNVSVLTHEDRASLIHNIFALSRYDRQHNYLFFKSHSVKGELLKKSFLLSCGVNRLGRVSFQHVLNLLNYMPNETETSPVTEALLQLNNIYQLLDKRQEQYLVARMKVHAHTHKHTHL